MNGYHAMESRAEAAEARAEHLQSLVDSFFTGEQKGNGLDHAVLAQWGRRRIAEKRANKLAVLFQRKPA